MNSEIIYLKESDYQGYYVACLEVSGIQFISTSQYTLKQWREIFNSDLKDITIHER